jgi:asparagine synthetase B (glutamine-hydrolysing)
LSGASLVLAILNNTNLRDSDLSGANLRKAHFSNANLSDTNFSDAVVGMTTFARLDLSMTKGLETVQHYYPSTLGIDTIYTSQGRIPQAFLRGVGLDDTFIAYVYSLTNSSIQYYTCFLSYSSKDRAFAERLYTDLQSKGIHCWYDREDLKIGEHFPDRIEEAIRVYYKLLIVLSEHRIKVPPFVF